MRVARPFGARYPNRAMKTRRSALRTALAGVLVLTTPAALAQQRPAPTRPTVTVPPGPRPTDLQITDITTGTGATVVAGMTVAVQYVGVSWSTGREFDASWNRNGDPFSFTVGRQMVIPGWDRGLVGMRVGGRRRLVIPPRMGYGEHGSPPAIGANETLIFVIDLVSVR